MKKIWQFVPPLNKMGFRNFLAWGILKSTKHSGWNSYWYLLKRFESIWHAQKLFTTTNKPGVLRVFCCFASHGFVSEPWSCDEWMTDGATRQHCAGWGRRKNKYVFCHGPIFSQMPLSWRIFIALLFIIPKLGKFFFQKRVAVRDHSGNLESVLTFQKRRQNRSSQDPRNPTIMLFLCIVGYKHNHFTQCSFVIIQNISGTFLPMICQWQWLAFQGILCQWTWLNGNPTKRCTVAPTCLAAFHLTRASHQASHPL